MTAVPGEAVHVFSHRAANARSMPTTPRLSVGKQPSVWAEYLESVRDIVWLSDERVMHRGMQHDASLANQRWVR